MVRETRHLWVGNLPENIREDRIKEHFKRYGRVQNVKLLAKGEGSGSLCAAVAFMDIKSASKAHNAEHIVDERALTTEYYEPAAIPASSAGSSPAGSASSGSVGSQPPNATPNSRYEARHQSSEDLAGMVASVIGSSTWRGTNDSDTSFSRRGSTPAYQRVFRNGPTSAGYSPSERQRWFPATGAVGTESPKTDTPGGTSRSRKRSSASDRSSSSSPEPSSPESHSNHRKPEQWATTNGRALAICVRNLPLRSSDSSLKDGLYHEYKKHGKVVWVKMIGQNQDRYAIVRFKKPSDVEKALEVSQDKLFFGCKITVGPHRCPETEEQAEPELDEYHPRATRTLFIGNLDKDITDVHIRDKFKHYGRIVEVDIKKQSGGAGYAFCQFANIASVVEAIRALDGEYLGSTRMKLGFGKSTTSTCVWIDGLTEHTEKQVLSLVSRYGTATSVCVDRSAGAALVHFEQAAAAAAAVRELRRHAAANHSPDNRLAVDFASRECQDAFYEQLEHHDGGGRYSSVNKFEGCRSRTSSFSRTGSRTPRYTGSHQGDNHETTDFSRIRMLDENCGSSSPAEEPSPRHHRHHRHRSPHSSGDDRRRRHRRRRTERSDTPLRDELPLEPRPPPLPRAERPMSLPLPRFAARLLRSVAAAQIPPPPETNAPASPPRQHPSPSPSSSDAGSAPHSPSLEERIRSLDEKFEKLKGTKSSSVPLRHRLLDLDIDAVKPSDVAKSLLAKRSVFDDDSERLAVTPRSLQYPFPSHDSDAASTVSNDTADFTDPDRFSKDHCDKNDKQESDRVHEKSGRLELEKNELERFDKERRERSEKERLEREKIEQDEKVRQPTLVVTQENETVVEKTGTSGTESSAMASKIMDESIMLALQCETTDIKDKETLFKTNNNFISKVDHSDAFLKKQEKYELEKSPNADRVIYPVNPDIEQTKCTSNNSKILIRSKKETQEVKKEDLCKDASHFKKESETRNLLDDVKKERKDLNIDILEKYESKHDFADIKIENSKFTKENDVVKLENFENSQETSFKKYISDPRMKPKNNLVVLKNCKYDNSESRTPDHFSKSMHVIEKCILEQNKESLKQDVKLEKCEIVNKSENIKSELFDLSSIERTIDENLKDKTIVFKKEGLQPKQRREQKNNDSLLISQSNISGSKTIDVVSDVKGERENLCKYDLKEELTFLEKEREHSSMNIFYTSKDKTYSKHHMVDPRLRSCQERIKTNHVNAKLENKDEINLLPTSKPVEQSSSQLTGALNSNEVSDVKKQDRRTDQKRHESRSKHSSSRKEASCSSAKIDMECDKKPSTKPSEVFVTESKKSHSESSFTKTNKESRDLESIKEPGCQRKDHHESRRSSDLKIQDSNRKENFARRNSDALKDEFCKKECRKKEHSEHKKEVSEAKKENLDIKKDTCDVKKENRDIKSEVTDQKKDSNEAKHLEVKKELDSKKHCIDLKKDLNGARKDHHNHGSKKENQERKKEHKKRENDFKPKETSKRSSKDEIQREIVRKDSSDSAVSRSSHSSSKSLESDKDEKHSHRQLKESHKNKIEQNEKKLDNEKTTKSKVKQEESIESIAMKDQIKHPNGPIDKQRHYSLDSPQSGRRKERVSSSSSLPSNLNSKRRMSSQDFDNILDITKKAKTENKVVQRRDSRDNKNSEKCKPKFNKDHFAKILESKTKDDKKNHVKLFEINQEKESNHSNESFSICTKIEDKEPIKIDAGIKTDETKPVLVSPIEFLANFELRSSEEDEKQKALKKEISEKRRLEKIQQIQIQQEELNKLKEKNKAEDKRRDLAREKRMSIERKSREERLEYKKKNLKQDQSTDTSDSDEPKKHSIFDIPDEGPNYISMYDKVKARSCKNMQKQEEKRQQKIKKKFNQLKQSRAKRDDRKRSSWEEDSESDEDHHKSNFASVSSSEDERRHSKLRSEVTDSENDFDRHNSLDKFNNYSFSTDNDSLNNVSRKNSRSALIIDSSDDDHRKSKLFLDINEEKKFSRSVYFNDSDSLSSDFSHSISRRKEGKLNFPSSSKFQNLFTPTMNSEELFNIIKAEGEIKKEDTEPLEKLEIKHNIENGLPNTIRNEICYEQRRLKKSHNKSKDHSDDDSATISKTEKLHPLCHENNFDKEKKYTARRERKKERRRSSSFKDGLSYAHSKTSPNFNSKVDAQVTRREGKMEDIFGPISDDSDVDVDAPRIKALDECRMQISTFDSDSKPLSELAVKEEHRKRRHKRNKLKEKCIIFKDDENSLDVVAAGKAIEESLFADVKEVTSVKNDSKEQDVFLFTEKDDGLESAFQSEDQKFRNEAKERKKKKKRSREERNLRKDRVLSSEESILTVESTDVADVTSKGLPTLRDMVLPETTPKTESNKSSEHLIADTKIAELNIVTDLVSIMPDNLTPDTEIEKSNDVLDESELKKCDNFVPAFNSDVDISETAVKSISTPEGLQNTIRESTSIKEVAEIVEGKPEERRVTISQEETEDAVAALLGESFGVEEERAATPASERELQIDTDAEDDLAASSPHRASPSPPQTIDTPAIVSSQLVSVPNVVSIPSVVSTAQIAPVSAAVALVRVPRPVFQINRLVQLTPRPASESFTPIIRILNRAPRPMLALTPDRLRAPSQTPFTNVIRAVNAPRLIAAPVANLIRIDKSEPKASVLSVTTVKSQQTPGQQASQHQATMSPIKVFSQTLPKNGAYSLPQKVEPCTFEVTKTETQQRPPCLRSVAENFYTISSQRVSVPPTQSSTQSPILATTLSPLQHIPQLPVLAPTQPQTQHQVSTVRCETDFEELLKDTTNEIKVIGENDRNLEINVVTGRSSQTPTKDNPTKDNDKETTENELSEKQAEVNKSDSVELKSMVTAGSLPETKLAEQDVVSAIVLATTANESVIKKVEPTTETPKNEEKYNEPIVSGDKKEDVGSIDLDFGPQRASNVLKRNTTGRGRGKKQQPTEVKRDRKISKVVSKTIRGTGSRGCRKNRGRAIVRGEIPQTGDVYDFHEDSPDERESPKRETRKGPPRSPLSDDSASTRKSRRLRERPTPTKVEPAASPPPPSLTTSSPIAQTPSRRRKRTASTAPNDGDERPPETKRCTQPVSSPVTSSVPPPPANSQQQPLTTPGTHTSCAVTTLVTVPTPPTPTVVQALTSSTAAQVIATGAAPPNPAPASPAAAPRAPPPITKPPKKMISEISAKLASIGAPAESVVRYASPDDMWPRAAPALPRGAHLPPPGVGVTRIVPNIPPLTAKVPTISPQGTTSAEWNPPPAHQQNSPVTPGEGVFGPFSAQNYAVYQHHYIQARNSPYTRASPVEAEGPPRAHITHAHRSSEYSLTHSPNLILGEHHHPLGSPNLIVDNPQLLQNEYRAASAQSPGLVLSEPRCATVPRPAHSPANDARRNLYAGRITPPPAHGGPAHASQVPREADSLQMLLRRYPVMWQGMLALKTDSAAVQMHFVGGNPRIASRTLPRLTDGSTPPLRISQRMRLEPAQLLVVSRKIQMENEHCMMLALPCGRDHMDVLQQSNNLTTGFITYLQSKLAAGIVNIALPGCQQPMYTVHVFPSCQFANENLNRIAPDLLHRVADIAHLLILIATV